MWPDRFKRLIANLSEMDDIVINAVYGLDCEIYDQCAEINTMRNSFCFEE
jgi:hypothetical protein